MEAIRGEYDRDLLDQEKHKTRIETMRDVYIIGLDTTGGEKRSKVFHGDATKNLKVRVEEKIGLQNDRIKKQTFENVYEVWQEKSLKQMYKMTDRKYHLIDKGEYEVLNKIVRVETMFKKNDLIMWSTDRHLDYYLYCEKGVTEGVFIKVDVISAHSGENYFRECRRWRPPEERILEY